MADPTRIVGGNIAGQDHEGIMAQVTKNAELRTLNSDFWTNVQAGLVPGYSIAHKFGSNLNAGTTLQDIWSTGGFFKWATVAAPLEAISSSADDTAAGTGARVITVEGLDADFKEISEDIVMNGILVTTTTIKNFIRVQRVFVKDAGTYTTTIDGSNLGTITIRFESAGDIQSTIEVNTVASIGVGQSEQSLFTIPAGKSGFLHSSFVNVDAVKAATFYFWQRQNADVITAPFSSRRLIFRLDGISGASFFNPDTPIGSSGFPEKTDLWMSSVASLSNTIVESDFEIVLIDNDFIS